MLMHNETEKELKNIGRLRPSASFDRILILFLAVGMVIFVAGMFADPNRVWYNYLIEFFFFTCLALGGLLFAAVQYMTSAAWSVSIRRIAEGMAIFLPISLVLPVSYTHLTLPTN